MPKGKESTQGGFPPIADGLIANHGAGEGVPSYSEYVPKGVQAGVGYSQGFHPEVGRNPGRHADDVDPAPDVAAEEQPEQA